MPNIKDFFFVDKYRIIVNIILFLAMISFVIVIYLVCSKKNSSFSIIFKIMLNVMISALLSGIGYIFNWKKDDVLIFGDGNSSICKIQSVILGLFQTSRESFLVILSFLIYLNYKKPNFNFDKYKTLSAIIIYFFGYGIPLIANIIYIVSEGYGESDLFCFTKKNKDNKDNNPNSEDVGTIISIIHYTYIIFLVILNFYFTFYIIFHEVCKKNKEGNDLWEEEDNNSCFNPLLNKLIYYPFAQIISLSGPIVYRIMTFSDESEDYLKDAAGICAILNCFSTFLHTFIFALSNILINCKKKEEEIKENQKLINLDNF